MFRGLTLLSIGLLAGSTAAQNFLVVVLDDVGVDKIGAYAEEAGAGPTPVIDLLADQGVLFRNAWAFPVCSPSRASTLTGRYPLRHGIGLGVTWVSYDGFVIDDDEWTLPEALSQRGYRTAVVGKWHLSNQSVTPDAWMHPILFGFDRHRGAIDNLENYYEWDHNDASAAGTIQTPTQRYATTQAVDDALLLLDEWGSDEPWFLWLAFNAPHMPLHVPPEALHTQGDLADASPPELYRAMVEAIDTELGRLLAGIDPEVLAETYIIVFGDNGTFASASIAPFGVGLNNKGSVLEGGVNVPFVVTGPGVVPGESAHLVSSVDLFDTLLDLARPKPPLRAVVDGVAPTQPGGTPPGDVILAEPTRDSVSFAAVLRDPDAPPARSWVYTQRFIYNGAAPYDEWREALRDDRYKLVRRGGPELREWMSELDFYDLWVDPFELDNLVLSGPLSSEQQERFDALSSVGDDMPWMP